MKQILLLPLLLGALFALHNNSVISQEDLARIKQYLETYNHRYIGDSLYSLASLEQIPDSDVIALKRKYCESLATLWEKIPDCPCEQLNLAALTLKCEDKRRAELDFQILKLTELAYITRTLTTESVPDKLAEAIQKQNLECDSSDQTATLLGKMQLLKVVKGEEEKREKCLEVMEEQSEFRISSELQIENLIEVHGLFILANEEKVANKKIMKGHSEQIFKARNYLTERQYHKYRPRMMFSILRSVMIMREYERLVAPVEIKLEKGTEQTFSVRLVNTMNELIKENYELKLSILAEDKELKQLQATYDENTSRYAVIIPGDFEIGDYTIRWSLKVVGHYTYVFTGKLTVMYGRLEIVRVEYDDGMSGYQEVGRSEIGSAQFKVKESMGEIARVGIILDGLQTIVPRYMALNLYKGRELRYTILGTVSQNEELISFYFPKYFEEEVAEETKFIMEFVAGDRWFYNCPLYQNLGTITIPGSKMRTPPLIPSKYQPKELLYFDYGQRGQEPPALAVYGMIALMLFFLVYFCVLSRPLQLNCEKWNSSPQKAIQAGFVLCLVLIIATMVAFFLGMKLIPTLQILGLLGRLRQWLALPTVFFISKALSGLQIIDY